MSINKFKVGDWVVTNPTPNSYRGINIGIGGFVPNTLLQIKEIKDSEDIKGIKYYTFINITGLIYEGNFRHATEEEIRLGKPIINKIYKIW